MASINQSPEVKSILKQTHDLTTALSNDPLGVAGRLLSKELICEEEHSKMLVHGYTPAEKAAILVSAVRNTIKIAPDKFQWFLEILSEVVFAREVVERLRSTYQSLSQDQAKTIACKKLVDIDVTIEDFECRFRSLQKEILHQLIENKVDTSTVVNSITLLPMKLKNEYEKAIQDLIPFFSNKDCINELFFRLNPLLSFLDCGLLEHIINEYGSSTLKQDMTTYSSDIVTFMKETTIKQLTESDHFSSQPDIPPKFSLLKARIGEDASKCTLEHLNRLRKRFCSEVQLSKTVCLMVAVVKSNSFIVRWLVPSAFVDDIVKSTRNVDHSFYQEFKITSLTLDGMWLFLSEAEIDAMWLKMCVGHTEFNSQFHIMHKQILCEVDGIGRSAATDKLSSYLMDQQPTLQQDASVNISEAILSTNFPVSVIDFRMLTIVIELFGSDYLKRVMESYCCFMSTFVRQSTLEQLIDLLPTQSRVPEDFLTAECKIKGEPFEYGLEKLFEFQTRFCSMVNIDTVCFVMGDICKEVSGSFTVSWYIPSAAVFFMKFARNILESFYQEYQITSLTLDGMWIKLSDAEIDAMWSRLHVSDTKFKAQFHTMYRQIVYELEMAQVTGQQLSLFFEKSLEYHQMTSYSLSHELLNYELPISVIDFRVLAAAIEGFGSDCLKSVMSSYSKYISTFLKKPTAQQLINLSAIQLRPSEYSIVKCRIKEEPSQYTLDKFFSFRTRFCTIINISELSFVMDEVNIEVSGSFTVSWLVPPDITYSIMKLIRNVDQRFYHRFNITSLTLDGMWLYYNMSESEIDAMWSQVNMSDTKFKDQFHTMCEQIVYEMKLQDVSEDRLSLYFQSLNYQQQVSDQFSVAILEEEFPASFIDFGILKTVIERFGSDCLKRVMESYCNYISIFTKESNATAQQLINIGNMSTIQSTDFNHFKIARCKIMAEPASYKIEKLLSFRTRFCTITHLSKAYFIMSEVNTETKDSFTVSWLVSPAIITDIMNRNIDQSFYQEYKITSLTLDGMWLHMSKAELDVMWIHTTSSAKLIDQFQIISKQIVLELKIQNTPIDELSQCLMNQHPILQKDTSIFLSEAILSFPFSPSGFFLDFDTLNIVIEEFGSDCLGDVMMSYCKFLSGFIEQLTVQQLLELPSVRTKHHEGFIEVECRIMEKPSGYTCDKILSIRNSICAETDISGFMLIVSHDVRKPLLVSDSFLASWLIPTQFAPDLIESANRIDSAFYVRKSIASLSIGNHWVYNQKLTPLRSKVNEKYQQFQGSPSPVEWIPSPTKKIFRLAMIERERVQRGHIEDRFVRMTISGRVDDILHAKSPVELEHIFRNTLHGGEIILIEGAPGSGKSTLTVHICQRWGKGELFQQFNVVILVQLRDPAVQRAQTIADLLPVENAEEIATELIATNGRGALWVLDGWDELPPHLQQESIFRKLIKRVLSECSVIVTSRPISSGDLHPVVSSRIEVLGFTLEEQRRYFAECLKGDTKALEALLGKIQENPIVQNLCYLPLNAAFVVHTFKYRDQSLPNTEYEIYLSVILSCIQRHFDREDRGHDLPRELASLDDLSRIEAVREPFQCLCELAYHGVMKNKVTFSSSDLPQGSNTLSLLQVIESFLQSGKSVFYNFLHLSVQEVLSAYYITTKLSDSEQVSQFQQLFNQPRFAAVFQFYAAITKLKSPGIRQVIDRIVEAKSKPLLVSLLRCLHEAQDPDLCLYVAERLEYRLDLSETSLSPLDCLSVSFFLSTLSCKEISCNLALCQIGDLGAKCLAKYLSMSSYADLITINLKGSDIHDEGAAHIAKLLHFTERLHLDISENTIGDTGASFILEALRTTTTLKSLTLVGYAIFSTRTEDILIALGQNNSLKKFDVFWNNPANREITRPSFQLMASVDKHAKTYAFTNLDIVTKDATKLSMNLSSCLSAEELNSFIITWRIPPVPVCYLIESAKQIGRGYFEMKHIHSLSVGNHWLYNPKLSAFGSTLKQRYQQSQGSPSPVEWTPSPTKKIFRLAMIQRERVQRGHIEDRFIRMTISGRVDDILYAKSPVELEHIFRKTLHGGEIILIEGAPGSGKNTLTVHICQKWGKGELFQQFTVVILVQLRDPAVQRAQTIADLLPVENAKEIAAELIATSGRGVLWVLDGWDELPPHLQQDSIFCKLLPPKRSKQNLAEIERNPVSQTQFYKYYKDRLNEASIIVTSRPISSGDLHPVVSSRIEVLGFTPEEQRQYFTDCLKGDTKALEALLEKIQENPVVQSICYLPLNAAFIVHTFKYRDQSLPNTEYEIYLSVILSCIQRHYDREGRGHDLPRELACLEDLSRSEIVREPFHYLCELAYCGMMENKVTFSSSDLPQGSNTLSLLQAIESFLQSGKSLFYNFLHLSFQEVLSAYYIATRLSDSEQVSQFQQLFNQPRFAAVFQFYAVITKLKSPGIRQVITKMVEGKSKPLLVSLLRCLHEAQDAALCLYVAERLEYRLDLSETSLSPLDYLCISFFLFSLSGKKVSVNLRQCYIGDIGTKCLTKFLHSDKHYTSNIAIDLHGSNLNQKDASYIARMLYYIEHVYLSHNPIGDAGASLISEAVRKTTTLKTLILYNCDITSSGVGDLSKALVQSSSLEKLDIGGNYLMGNEGISHVAEALKQNKQLKELWIGNSIITDKGAASLSSALTVNNSLKMLHIGGPKGALTGGGLSTIAHSLANKPLFVRLVIPTTFVSTVFLSLEVNEARKSNRLPPIKIEATGVISHHVPSKY